MWQGRREGIGSRENTLSEAENRWEESADREVKFAVAKSECYLAGVCPWIVEWWNN